MEGEKSNSLAPAQAAALTKATNGKPVFTFLQLQEFAHQALIFRHMAAGIPVPFHLIVPIQSGLYPSFMGCREGDSKNSMEEPERGPGRCRKTDGKKRRCSRDVVPERMFCESHTNRGRNRLRKRRHVESPYQNASSSTTNSTPSPDLHEVGQVLIGNPGGGSFTFQHPAQHVPQTAELGLTESGPSRVPILESTLFDDDDDIELVEISAPVGERASGAGSGSLPQSNVAPTSEKGKGVSVDLAGMDMSTDEAIYQWACKHHLLAVPAEETDLSLNAEVREKMWVTQHDRIYNNLTFTPAPPASVAEMTSLVDGQAYFFPQFALAMLSQNQQYCYQLYQLHKLKAAKYEALYRSVDTDLVAKREEVCNLQQQLLQDNQYKDRADSLEQEAEGLRKELANIKVDLEKAAPNAQLIEKLSTLQKELETSKTEVVSLRGQLSYSEGLVSSTEQCATLAETKTRNLRFEVQNIRAQALAATATHAQDVARIKAEARSNHRTKVNTILTKVNAETGKNYQLMP